MIRTFLGRAHATENLCGSKSFTTLTANKNLWRYTWNVEITRKNYRRKSYLTFQNDEKKIFFFSLHNSSSRKKLRWLLQVSSNQIIEYKKSNLSDSKIVKDSKLFITVKSISFRYMDFSVTSWLFLTFWLLLFWRKI